MLSTIAPDQEDQVFDALREIIPGCIWQIGQARHQAGFFFLLCFLFVCFCFVLFFFLFFFFVLFCFYIKTTPGPCDMLFY